MLAQLRTDTGKQHGEAERLRDIVVGAGLETEDRIRIGVVPGQHDDRRLEAALAQKLHRLAAIHVGQADIHDQEVHLLRPRGLDALAGGRFLDEIELFIE
ncbi:hypothetical protein D9M72_403880 [compost metagenome]